MPNKGDGIHFPRPRSNGNAHEQTDLEKQLEAFSIENHPAVLEARKVEAHALKRYEQEQAKFANEITATLRDAESQSRSARLALAEGVGSEADFQKAKKAHELAIDKYAGEEDLIRALGAKLADLREVTRQAEDTAAQKVRTEVVRLTAVHVEQKNQLLTDLEQLKADDITFLAALERVCPERFVPIGQNGHGALMGSRRIGWDEKWRSVLESTPHGTQFKEWQALAEDAGLLPESEAGKRRHAAERQRLQELEEVAKRKNSIDDWRLGHFRAWGAGADLPMPEGKR